MTPEQALNILDQATAQLNGPRGVHVQINQALKVIADALSALQTQQLPVSQIHSAPPPNH